jgi:hypothetical protein
VSVEDDKCSGRPSTSKMKENVEKIWELIHKDRRWTIYEYELADTVGDQLWSLPGDLKRKFEHARCIATKFAPRLMTNDQKQRHINMCLVLWEKTNEDPTFTRISKIRTGDESWIYGYNPETK